MLRLEKSRLHKLFPSPLSFIFLVSLKEEKGRIIKECEIEEAGNEEGLKTLRLPANTNQTLTNLFCLKAIVSSKTWKLVFYNPDDDVVDDDVTVFP